MSVQSAMVRQALTLALTSTALLGLTFSATGCHSSGKKKDDAARNCVDFEDLVVGTSYTMSNTFTDSGVTLVVDEFQWPDGTWVNTGHVDVNGAQQSTGTGHDLRFNNSNVEFLFGPVAGLTLRFADYGGNENLVINGQVANTSKFLDLHGTTVAGVTITVNVLSTTASATVGDLTLVGPISTFQIGGQELWIDNVCIH